MTQMSNTYDRQHLVASVIAAARNDYGRGAAAFDYGIATGSRNAEMSLSNAVFVIANRGLDGDASTKQARQDQLREELASDLDAFRTKCRGRKYTGWSAWSTGPIRYADAK